jgi:hypothetical protein
MKRTLFLALIAVSAIVMAPLASADRHEQFSGPTSSTELLTVDTTACPDFVTAPQPYPVRGLGNFEMNATWKGTWVREPGFFTDVRGRMKGDGVDSTPGSRTRSKGSSRRMCLSRTSSVAATSRLPEATAHGWRSPRFSRSPAPDRRH